MVIKIKYTTRYNHSLLVNRKEILAIPMNSENCNLMGFIY